MNFSRCDLAIFGCLARRHPLANRVIFICTFANDCPMDTQWVLPMDIDRQLGQHLRFPVKRLKFLVSGPVAGLVSDFYLSFWADFVYWFLD